MSKGDFLNTIFQEYLKYRYFKGVFVYQYGKVASTSFTKSIPDSVAQHQLFGNYTNALKYKINYSLLRILGAKVLKKIQLLGIKNRPKTKILTLIRNPLYRNISMFFQDLPYWLVQYDKYLLDNKKSYLNKTNNSTYLLDAFIAVFPHDYCDLWFKNELSHLVGRDLLNISLMDESVYLFTNEKYDLLVAKFENLNEIMGQIRKFVGEDFVLLEENRASNKWYKDIYKDAYQQITSSDWVINEYSSQKLMRQYSND
jgi:hypothetical protein